MRSECLNHKYSYGTPMITGRLVAAVADKYQKKTMASWKRPYGVGILTIGADRDGPHLYQNDPSGNFMEYKAMAFGSRSQSAKTYLEKHLASFADGKCTEVFMLHSPNSKLFLSYSAALESLVLHALKALEGSANDEVSKTKNFESYDANEFCRNWIPRTLP